MLPEHEQTADVDSIDLTINTTDWVTLTSIQLLELYTIVPL